jgi:hypothetical protein
VACQGDIGATFEKLVGYAHLAFFVPQAAQEFD